MTFLKFQSVAPDLLLVVCACYAINYPANFALGVTLFSSLVIDCLSSFPIGVSAMARFIPILGIAIFKKRIYSHILTAMIFIAGATLIKELVIILIYLIIKPEINLAIYFALLIYKIAYNTLITPIVYIIFNLLFKKDIELKSDTIF